MTLILPSTKISPADTLFLFRASDCIDEEGIFARSYGRRLGGAFSRGSRKVVADSRGALVRLPDGAPPLAWIGGEPGMLLEPARTNRCTDSENIGVWGNDGVTVTPNVIQAPDGTSSADLLTPSGFISQARFIPVVFGSNGTKAVSVFVRIVGSVSMGISLYDNTAGAHRHYVTAQVSGGSLSLVTTAGSGVRFDLEGPFAFDWYRVSFNADGVIAANQNLLYLYPDNQSGAFSCAFWGAQAEDAAVPSSYIKTEGSTVTRNADSLYFPFNAPPQVLTVYARTINRGQYAADSATKRFIHIGGANPSTDPRLSLFGSTSGRAGVQYDNGTAEVSVATGPLPALGDVVEHVGSLNADWSVTAGVSVNAGAESIITSSASGLAAAWAAQRIYFTGALTSENTLAAYTHVVVAAGVKTMDEMRALAGV